MISQADSTLLLRTMTSHIAVLSTCTQRCNFYFNLISPTVVLIHLVRVAIHTL